MLILLLYKNYYDYFSLNYTIKNKRWYTYVFHTIYSGIYIFLTKKICSDSVRMKYVLNSWSPFQILGHIKFAHTKIEFLTKWPHITLFELL